VNRYRIKDTGYMILSFLILGRTDIGFSYKAGILHNGEAGNWMWQCAKCSTYKRYHTKGNDFMNL
jgi:hypothetical protein